MGESTTQVRQDIERTRAEMSGTIDAIADRTSPSRIVGRQRQRVSDRVRSVRETVMGTAEGATSSLQQSAGSATDTAREMPEKVRSQAQGNPLAAGIIAFGGGLLAASILSSSRPERQAASKLREEAQPALEQVKQSGQQVAEELKSTAQEAATQVKDTASQSAQHVAEEAKGSAQQVQEQAKFAGQDVAKQAKGAAEEVRSKS